MKINLNDPKEFTIDNVKALIASEEDNVHTQFRVTQDGFLFLSKDVGNRKLEGIIFRLETNGAFNGYVGENAAKDESWVARVFNVINENWPRPKSPYCDNF
ncbi:hypothetical protein D0X99_19595 [Algoriphagus lacus]|uniref:Uncharacterized protein n=1 Tax=Algoriphagus lacus TaxID=2056311 RepID=A0A418PLU0_9BACT|nr:hypothetical protein [Algoriphagus lacus]RIW12162.1 hypothetical protein D0X99_19595 [Algoriphagus lacus]